MICVQFSKKFDSIFSTTVWNSLLQYGTVKALPPSLFGISLVATANFAKSYRTRQPDSGHTRAVELFPDADWLKHYNPSNLLELEVCCALVLSWSVCIAVKLHLSTDVRWLCLHLKNEAFAPPRHIERHSFFTHRRQKWAPPPMIALRHSQPLFDMTSPWS